MTTVISESSAAAAPPPMDDTPRVADLRERVRRAMERPPAGWACPERIAPEHMTEPIPIRKARAIALKLAHMPTDLWRGQLLAGSMTLEDPRVHSEWGFPDYLTAQERQDGAARGLSTSCFGHIVPDYPRLLTLGLGGIQELARGQLAGCRTAAETAFLESVLVATDGVLAFASRLADRCEAEALAAEGRPGAGPDPAATAVTGPARAAELRQMADNLRQSPSGPARTFWQGLQSVWLLHMVFHSTLDGNAAGRVDQYTWPLLRADLAEGRIDLERAGELVDCFCLKFNERAKATEDQAPESRHEEHLDPLKRTRHSTSSQIGTERDGIDATNHWLQNIVVGGLRPGGQDGTNPVTFLLLESYRRNRMTNPLLTVRLHAASPAELVRRACETLKEGGGMPAIFSDEAIVPALERLGIPTGDARDYTNDGCWEVILPGRTDFRFQRLSVMLCLEWAINRGRSRLDGAQLGIDTGEARGFQSFEDVWRAFEAQLDAMVAATLDRVTATFDDRSILAPVPLLSALIDGAVESRRDMTAGGAKFRTFALLAEGAAHAIDSLSAIRHVIFERRQATLAELCDAMDADFRGHEVLRKRLQEAPKYGNDDERADSVGRDVIRAFTETVSRHAAEHEKRAEAGPAVWHRFPTCARRRVEEHRLETRLGAPRACATHPAQRGPCGPSSPAAWGRSRGTSGSARGWGPLPTGGGRASRSRRTSPPPWAWTLRASQVRSSPTPRCTTPTCRLALRWTCDSPAGSCWVRKAPSGWRVCCGPSCRRAGRS
jgi:choline trimethylamine-lyase